MTRSVLAKELKVLWASPVPYVVGALVHALLGLIFVSELRVRSQAVIQPLFPLAGFLLLAAIPLLAMRTFAEEVRTGTLDLLLAVPVPARPLVVGKWLAVWLSTLALLTPAGIYVALLARWGDPDPGPVITGFLGLALLAAALSGIGVVSSTLSASQPVAAMVALFVGLLLWFAYVGSDTLSLGPVLLHFSLSERLRNLAGGALDTADVAFFAVLAAATLLVAGGVVAGRRHR